MANESKDPDQVLDSIIDTIRACTDNKLKLSELTSFDIEYMFIKLRAKSVGETITLHLPCTECEKRTETTMSLDDVECPVDKNHDMIIKLDDSISVEMKYPGYKITVAETKQDAAVHAMAQCISAVISDDERIDVEDETTESVQAFLESMTRTQFEQITQFVLNIPQVQYTIEFECEHCSEHNEVEVKGLQNFF